MNKEKNAYSGWFLMWVLGMFQVIFARVGQIIDAETANWYASYLDRGGMVLDIEEKETMYLHPVSDDIFSQKEFFTQLIKLLDEIYNMDGVDINFKNTLIVVRREWEKMVV